MSKIQENFDHLLRNYRAELGEDVKKWCVIEDALRSPNILDTDDWCNTNFSDERVRHHASSQG